MPTGSQDRRAGFTLTELIVAVVLFGIVTAFVVPGYIWMLRFARSGSAQAGFNIRARQAEVRILQEVQAGRALAVYSNEVLITTADNAVRRIFYEDLDDEPSTLADNVLRFDPDATVDDDEETLCGSVCPFPGEPLFTNVSTAPMGVRVRFHIGEGTNVQYTSPFSSSPGFQGVEVRLSATPRNRQTWYQ